MSMLWCHVNVDKNVFLYICCVHVIKAFWCKVTSDVYLPHLPTDRPSEALSQAVSSDEQQTAAADTCAHSHISRCRQAHACERAVTAQAKCHRLEAFTLSEVDRCGPVGGETPSASNQSRDAAFHRNVHLLMQMGDEGTAAARACTLCCCGKSTDGR